MDGYGKDNIMDVRTLADRLRLTPEDFTSMLRIGSTGEGTASTRFGADGGRTIVRGGLGNDAYVARIVGTDPEWGFKREFVSTDKDLSRSGASGNVHFLYGGDGLYSYGRVTVSSTTTRSGFFLVLDGKIADLGNKRATLVKALTALETEVVSA